MRLPTGRPMRAPAQAIDAQPPALTAGPVEGLSLADMGRLLRTRARTLVACVLATTALGLVVIALTPTSYVANTSLLIDPTIRAPLGSAPGVVPQGGSDTALINSQVRILTSTSVLTRVVKSQYLTDDPDFKAAPGFFGRLKNLIEGAPALDSASGNVTIVAGELAKEVSVSHQDQSNVIDIAVAAHRPGKAARLANALVAAYFADQQQARDNRSTADSVAIDARLATLRQQFLQSESAYEAWRASHQLYDADGKPLGEIDLGNAAKILGDARATTAAAKARFQQVEQIVASGHGIGALSSALKSPLMDKLRTQYADVARQKAMYAATLGPRNPALIQSESQLHAIAGLIASELHRIGANAASQYQEARAREVAAERQVTALKTGSAKSSADSVEAQQLKNDVDARRNVYQSFLRARDSMADAPVEGQLARVISPATPPLYAAAPAKKLILSLAVVIGLFLGAALALLGDMFAPSAAAQPARVETPTEDRRDNMAKPGIAVGTDTNVAHQHQQEQSLQQLFDDLFAEHQACEPKNTLLSLMVAALSYTAACDPAALELAKAGAAHGLRVLLIEAERSEPLYVASLRRSSGVLILLSGTPRPSYLLKTSDLVRVVPMLRDETAALREMAQRQGAIEGFRDNFDLVIFETGLLTREDHQGDLAARVDRVIFVTDARSSGAASISRALRQLDVPPDRLGGVWVSGDAATQAA